MIKNYYYFILAILTILFSFSHAWNGHTTILPIIDGSSINVSTKTTLFYVWHIITAENVIFGGAFFVMAFSKEFIKIKFTAWVIASIMIARWLIIFGSTLYRNVSGLNGILTDTIAIMIYVGLIILGTRERKKLF